MGKMCEEDEKRCDESTCENNAMCVDLFQDFFCSCPSGTDGKRCETSPQRCIGDPCMNAGSCSDLGYALNCSCSKDYTGIGCQYEYDACAANACKNGATCIDLTNDFHCRCPFNLTGEDCRKQIAINYDLSFTDPEKSTSASLVVPFTLNADGARQELSVAMWVQFETR